MTLYATVAQFKAQTGLTGTGDDVAINDILEGVTKLIDRVCNRPGGFIASTSNSYKYYVGSGGEAQRIDECVSISEVAVKDAVSDSSYTAWTSPTTNMAGDGDWFAASGNTATPELNRTPYTLLMIDINGSYSVFTGGRSTRLRGFVTHPDDLTSKRGIPTVRVFAKWGFATTVPDDIRDAAIMV
ncbi:MAG: hypothetical protein KKD77_22490, partial [Gammaproteobacteria bacterium]|nr:hypothetical protein [Gammaproteobacteria bacterium]